MSVVVVEVVVAVDVVDKERWDAPRSLRANLNSDSVVSAILLCAESEGR